MSSLKYIAGSDLQTVTLASAYTAADGHMHLTSGHGARLPTAGDFWLRTTSGAYSCFKVTARSTDDLTITPAQDGTSDGNLDSGTELKWVLGVAAFDQFRGDIVQSGTYANLPSGEKAGQIYIPTDSFYDFLRYTGAVWQHFRNGQLLTPPISGNFATTLNSPTLVTTNGGVNISGAAATAPAKVYGILKATPSTPYTITVALLGTFINRYHRACIISRQSSDGKLILSPQYGVGINYYTEVIGEKWTDASTYSGVYNRFAAAITNTVFLRLTDNGTDRISYASHDGYNWIQFHTVGRTDFCTPNQIGFGVIVDDGTYISSAVFIHWLET